MTIPSFIRRLLPLVAALAFAGSLHAQSTPNRIAVIDVQKILGESKAGQAATAKLQKMQEERMAQSKKLDDAIRQLLAAGRSEKDREISDKRRELERYMQNSANEITEARDRELAALEQKIHPIVEKVAAEMQLDAIFNKFESGLIFASQRLEITDVILKRFNEATR